ncbi:metallophosphoesterase family protein [Paenibacillus hamazuiensis]|uniref:metallophosphoesterase family protein n=1 Tax=Paenibacillus hamazuiensis TaxID=2936508 RepID=UPI00200CA554|nr:metallophosphoesterase family protein [Paenibacillus hamazuiensis]
MKLALLADIHGNYHALEAVLEDIGKQRADKVLVLGDIVFKGPLPERCVRAVRSLGTVVLQGNIDELVGKGRIQDGFAKSPEHEAALQRELAWNRERLSADELAYLAGLPLLHEEQLTPQFKLRCVHATPHSLLDIVLPTAGDAQVAAMFGDSGANAVAYAHIHLPYVKYTAGRAIFNTGSVGLPFDGDTRASYALLDTDGGDYAVTIRRLRYDLDAALAAFSGSGHPYAESVQTALKTGSRPA